MGEPGHPGQLTRPLWRGRASTDPVWCQKSVGAHSPASKHRLAGHVAETDQTAGCRLRAGTVNAHFPSRACVCRKPVWVLEAAACSRVTSTTTRLRSRRPVPCSQSGAPHMGVREQKGRSPPFASITASRGSTLVAMVQPADLGQLYHPAQFRPLRRPWFWCIARQ